MKRIPKYNEFKSTHINEDDTSNLINQKNQLTQQINDLQVKLLNVNQQILTAQKQTLSQTQSQNPQTQTQLPVSEMGNYTKHHIEPKGSLDPIADGPGYDIIDYGISPTTNNFFIAYTQDGDGPDVPTKDIEVPHAEFLDFVEKWAKSNHYSGLVHHYEEEDDSDFTGEQGWSKGRSSMNVERFWKDLDHNDQETLVKDFMKQKNIA